MKFKPWVILLALLSLIGTGFVYPMLPETIATHWGVDGQVNGTGGKITQLFIAGLPLLMYVLLVLMPRIDPRRENYALHNKAYTIFQEILVLFFIGLNWATIAYNLGVPLDIQRIVVIPLGIIIAVTGNYMGQIRHNYFFGIKTPWTLANEEVWRRTHRLGGYFFTAAGIIIIVSAFLGGTLSFILTMTALLGASIIPAVYSYLIFRKLQNKA